MVETKWRRYLDVDLVKAKRQAAKIHAELGVWVAPVLCLYHRQGEPFERCGVWIVPRSHLLDWIRRQRGRQVPFERLTRYADQL